MSWVKVNRPQILRKGSITIAQSNITAPTATKVERCLEQLIRAVNRSTATPVRKAAMLHAFFEHIHPFPDGNGRVGRILLNYVLIGHGFPNIALKGVQDEKQEYFAALEEADPYIGEVLRGRKRWTRAQNKPFVPLENLVSRNLAIALDGVICTRFDETIAPLLPLADVATRTKMSLQSLRTACSQKKVICAKMNNRLMSHYQLLQQPR